MGSAALRGRTTVERLGRLRRNTQFPLLPVQLGTPFILILNHPWVVGAVIILLLWLYITGFPILVGGQVN